LIEQKGTSAHVAFDIIVTRITRKLTEPTNVIVNKCIERIETGELSTDHRLRLLDPSFNVTGQLDCERLFHFLETGKIDGRMKYGRDALSAGRKWLAENGK